MNLPEINQEQVRNMIAEEVARAIPEIARQVAAELRKKRDED